ncbi:MAG: sulfotransferase family protein [Bacteroidota bacterium]
MKQLYKISSKVVPYIPNSIKNYLYKMYLFSANTLLKKEINNNPIFILGNHKSGTTAISMLISQGAKLSISGGLKKERIDPIYKDIYNYNITFETILKRNKIDFAKQIIKENQLTFFYNQIVKHFSNPKFIFLIRDPRDNIRSILNRINVQGDLIDASYHDFMNHISISQKLVLDNRWLGICKEHYIEALAERWNLAADTFLQNKDNIVLIKYEDFVKDKVGYISWITRKLGFTLQNNIEDLVDIQYQPKGNKNISWEDFFGNTNLSRIEEICKTRMKLFEYNF